MKLTEAIKLIEKTTGKKVVLKEETKLKISESYPRSLAKDLQLACGSIKRKLKEQDFSDEEIKKHILTLVKY